MIDASATASQTIDEDAILAVLTDDVGDALHVLAVYDRETFDVTYCSDTVESMYPDEGRMHAHFDRFHEYVHLDFMEKDLFEETLASGGGRVRSHATQMDRLSLVRVFVNGAGVFVATDPDVDVTAIVSAIEEIVDS